MLSLSSARQIVLFTCGWMITPADEDAIRQVPEDAWKPGTGQDGTAEDDKDVAEIMDLMSRAGNWPGGLRWIARRVKPSRRHMRNLTDYEKKTGWKYSITCTNIPDAGIRRRAGQPPPAIHRHRPPRTRRRQDRRGPHRQGHGPAEPPLPKTWQVNTGWVIAANIAADLAAWNRLLGFARRSRTCGKPTPARSATGSGTSPPGSPATPGSASFKISPDWPWKDAFLTCWQRLCTLPAPSPTNATRTTPPNAKGESTGAVGAGAHPGTPGTTTRPVAGSKPTPDPKPGASTISNRTSGDLND